MSFAFYIFMYESWPFVEFLFSAAPIVSICEAIVSPTYGQNSLRFKVRSRISLGTNRNISLSKWNFVSSDARMDPTCIFIFLRKPFWVLPRITSFFFTSEASIGTFCWLSHAKSHTSLGFIRCSRNANAIRLSASISLLLCTGRCLRVGTTH
mgnify:CR=1 FL=1